MRSWYLLALIASANALDLWPFGSGSSSSDASDSSSTSSSTTSSASSSDSPTSSSTTSGSSDLSALLATLTTESSTSNSSEETFGVPSTQTSTDGGLAYAPRQTMCPDFEIVRNATDLNEDEAEYIQRRHEITNENLIDFLDNVAQLSDFDAESFINDNKDTHNISIGLAFSGGGYRAMLCGAGEVLALDNRYKDSSSRGLGGLLQSSSYITGLSGGSWLVGTLVLNNWISVGDILEPDSGIWDLEDSIFNPGGLNLVKTIIYYNALGQAVSSKSDYGFQTTITDVWGRALSMQFFTDNYAVRGGENLTWSGIRNLASYKNHSMPYPIIVAGGRNPNTVIVDENSTVYEISPNELGSWDPSVRSFVNLTYMGTKMEGGKPNTSECIEHFDNAGFMMGTSSSLFNQALLRLPDTDLNWALKKIITMILEPLSKNEVDIAVHEPNPFYLTEFGESEDILTDSSLHLVDGGEDQQNVPLYPLIQKARDLDVIFAYDNSADTDEHWPNGTSFVHTFLRQFGAQGKGTPFPFVPSSQDFLDQGLTQRPVFFGCDAQNLTELIEFHDVDYNATEIPLVVYMPNSLYSHESNVSTFTMSYEYDEKLDLIQNGFEVSSRGNYTSDRGWPTCVGCAIIRRQQERLGDEQSAECKKCFEKYCWVGGIEDTPQSTYGSISSGAGTRTSSRSSSTSSSSSSSSTSTRSGGSSTTTQSASSGVSGASSDGSGSSSSAANVANLISAEVGSIMVGILGLLSIL